MKITHLFIALLLATPAFAQYIVYRTAAGVVQTSGLTHPAPLITTSIRPATNDGAPLGSTALGWSDIFFATGMVWNVANGDWVATHSAGIMTVGTGDFRITTAGTNAASVVTVGGTQALVNKTYNGNIITAGSSTYTGTAGQTYTFPTTTATIARTDAANTFTGTQTIGALVATTVNGNTITAGTGILTIAAAKTLTASNTLTFTGTDGSTAAFGAGGTVAYIGLANAWADGIKQTFNPDATTAGINVGAVAGDPSAPADGDVWYDSSANEFTVRINGANVALGSATLTSTQVGYGSVGNVLTGEAAFTYTAASNTVGVDTIQLGATGVNITNDTDGAITFLGTSAGSDEDLTLNLDDTANTVSVSSSTGVTTLALGAIGITSTGASSIGPLVDSVDGVTPLNNINQVVAAGTAYTLTTSTAAVDFGTTDPVLTIANAGTYSIYVNIQTSFVGLSYTAAQSADFKLRRTNNTAADLTGSLFSGQIPVQTLQTALGPSVSIGPIKYTTALTTDTITVFGSISAAVGAGSVTATACTITAIRAY